MYTVQFRIIISVQPNAFGDDPDMSNVADSMGQCVWGLKIIIGSKKLQCSGRGASFVGVYPFSAWTGNALDLLGALVLPGYRQYYCPLGNNGWYNELTVSTEVEINHLDYVHFYFENSARFDARVAFFKVDSVILGPTGDSV
jgi:hypothetical protein